MKVRHTFQMRMVFMHEAPIEGARVDGTERTAMFGSVEADADWYVAEVSRFNDRYLYVILQKDEEEPLVAASTEAVLDIGAGTVNGVPYDAPPEVLHAALTAS